MHQNPELGQANYVYVKLTNGGATMSGNLNVYWANASTGLSWPSNWNLISSVPVSVTGHSSKVVEATWSSLPGTGHYCLLARWVSGSDPMTFAETSNVDYNTRRNNNIAWRNVNIVDLHDRDYVPVQFVFRNIDPFPRPLRLAVRPPREEVENSFLRYGRLTIRLNDILFAAWREGGMQGKGFEMQDERTLVVTDPEGAELTGIYLPEKLEDTVELIFERGKEAPEGTFRIEATQWSEKGEMGGVAYDIHTDKYDGGAGPKE
jgi:hypothetical protein